MRSGGLAGVNTHGLDVGESRCVQDVVDVLSAKYRAALEEVETLKIQRCCLPSLLPSPLPSLVPLLVPSPSALTIHPRPYPYLNPNRNPFMFIFFLTRSVELQAVSTVVGTFDDRMIGLYMRCKDFAALHMASQRANDGLARENAALRAHVGKLEDVHANFILNQCDDEDDIYGGAPPPPLPEPSGDEE